MGYRYIGCRGTWASSVFCRKTNVAPALSSRAFALSADHYQRAKKPADHRKTGGAGSTSIPAVDRLPSSSLFDPALPWHHRPPRSPTSSSSLSYLCPLPLPDVHALPSIPLHHHLPVVALAVLGDAKLESVAGGCTPTALHDGGPHCPHPYANARGSYGSVTPTVRGRLALRAANLPAAHLLARHWHRLLGLEHLLHRHRASSTERESAGKKLH
ncbi:hypothetical protein B0H13DRAFT_1093561 [Mycena leptocephala]|nr:hypothetical protein B0H13DRAFT_1093561 [Mycena leptocephala]